MQLPAFISWNWSFDLIITELIILGIYIWFTGFKNMRKTVLFVSGLMLVALALALPLGPKPPGFTNLSSLSCALPGGTLFSMHMARHILLLMLAPPFIVAGLPGEPVEKFLSKPHIKPLAHKLLNPFVAWPLGVGIMWFWHVPPVYNYLTTYGTGFGHLIMPFIEVFSLLGIGFLYCWPIVSPVKKYRLPALKGIVYLFTACSACSILGIIITFASPGFYHTAFASTPGTIWGFTQKADQQAGGLLMWVPGCFIYLSGVMVLLARWYSYADRLKKSPAHRNNKVHA